MVHARKIPDAATAGGTPLVMVHGLAVSSRYFVPLLRACARGGVAASAPDLPGLGATPHRDGTDDVAGLADHLGAWLRTAGREPAVLVGNSMGAQIAVELAIRQPALVAGLVLVGPTVDPSARSAGAQLRRLLVDVPRERASLTVTVATDALAAGPRLLARRGRAALEHAVAQRLPHVQVPVLVIRGDRDPLVPRAWGREAAALARRGSYLELPGGHAVHHRHPEAVLAAIGPHLGS